MDELNLNLLKEGLPGVSKVRGAEHAEACLVSFSLHKHVSGVELEVKGTYNRNFPVIWDDVFTEQIRRAWNDIDDATESGACGIAFLLILALTEYTIVRRARKGTGVDYYLGYKNNLAFQNAARVEVSGIFKATSERDIMRRVKQKLEQTNLSDGTMPVYVVLVEFSKPVSYVVKK
jgi:hypothetical protein